MMGSPGNTAIRVVHVLPWPNVGGTEIATLRLIRAAESHGITSSVLIREDARPVRTMFESAGVPTRTYTPATPSYRHAAAYLRQSQHFARLLRELAGDVVHCADVTAAFQTALGVRLAGLRVISHVRNRYREFPARLRPVLRLVDRFVFVSRQTWSEFGYRVSPERGNVLYDGIALPDGRPDARLQRRAEFQIPPDAPVVGMVARVARQKDYETLVRAAAEVLKARPDCWFVVVGDYEEPQHRTYHEEIREMLSRLGIGGRFLFTGYRSDVPDWLSAFDVFALSTHWEGFPLVILEAMAAGLPVVATAVDGIPEVVVPGETGYLAPPSNPQALAEALLKVLNDRSALQRLGEKAKLRITHEFGEERFREDVGRLYRSLLPEQSHLAS